MYRKKSSVFTIVVSMAIFLFLTSCGDQPKKIEVKKSDSTSVKTPEALSKLNDSINSEPQNPNLYYHRANYYCKTQQIDMGMNDIQKAIQIDSTKSEYYITLSDLCFVSNKTGDSKTALEKAVKLNDKNINALLKLAELHLYVKQNDQSIEYLNQVLKIDQYNSKAYFMKGMNFKELKDTAKAISSMQTAVEQDQQYYNAYMQLGLLCAAKNKKVAADYYKNAIRIQPKSVEAWYDLGKFYQDEHDWNNAMGTYSTLLTFDQNKNAAYNLGAINLLEIKNYPKAIEYFTAAINIDAKYVDAYYGRGLSLLANKNKEEAIKDFNTCLSIDPAYSPAIESLKKMK